MKPLLFSDLHTDTDAAARLVSLSNEADIEFGDWRFCERAQWDLAVH
jgi:hypothetical protein